MFIFIKKDIAHKLLYPRYLLGMMADMDITTLM